MDISRNHMNVDNKEIRISIVVPVYNRPEEVKQLLDSLACQTRKHFEVIVVEDGSNLTCDTIVRSFEDRLDVKYFYKENSGPGQSRNYGVRKAGGNYCIFLDSDCVLPPGYIETVFKALTTTHVDAFGGPDQAHRDFSDLQKAINYSMTSFFTTGGIRGSSEKLDKFYPRSFNMGYSREVFDATGGFSKMRFGEDIDMSIRILEGGFKTKLIKAAFVYHKRRTNLRQFFKQVYNSGIARINLYKRHPGSLKAVHFAPGLFVIGATAILVASVYRPYLIFILLAHAFLLFIDSVVKNKSLIIGLLSVITSYTQLFGYGMGFIHAFWKRMVLRKEEYEAFRNTFYK